MAAYHKVEVSLNTNAVEVGIPSPQSVTVTVPTVGPAGPTGPQGPKGDPGEVSGSIAWDNVTDKPASFTPSSHTHVAADITDFTAAVEAVSPPADWDTLANKPASFTPSAHAGSHATAGSDPLAPSDIGAQSIFTTTTNPITGDTTITAGRALIFQVVTTSAVTANISLPSSGHQAGDVIVVRSTGPFTAGTTLTIKSGVGSTLDTITAINQAYRYTAGSSSPAGWIKVLVDTHTHAASDITSGNLTHERGGLEADVSAYSGLVKISGGSTSAVTVTAAGEALLDDADASAQRTTLGLGNSATLDTGTTAGTVAEGNHTHELANLDATGATDGHVLTADGAGGAAWEAASGGVSAVGASTADVLSVSGSDLVADDGGTIDSADPFIKWDDTAGKLVYANPLSRPSGAFYVGLAPTTTAIGSGSVNIQPSRTAATQVASGTNCVAIGPNTTCGNSANVVIGVGCSASGSPDAVVIGNTSTAGANGSVVIGWSHTGASQRNCVVMGGQSLAASYRAEFVVPPFRSAYWGGQTTNDTATILNLDATATNRFTIAANTALAVDILLVARRSDTADKWLVARRFLGIRRDGSNNTSLIGSVQTLGTDQSDGSPTWSFTLTADDTNEALQLEVTGAASETVQWRATAFYRVV